MTATGSSLSGTTTSYTYNGDGERLSVAQGSTKTVSAAWNGAGSLTSYDDSAANMTSASYNGDGLRQATTVTKAGGTAVTQDYAWDTQGASPQLLMDGTNAYIYTDGTAPAEQVNLATGAVTYLVEDSLGSVRGVVSSSGALAATASYDAWGNPGASGGLTAATHFGFAGSYTDPTGLSYLVNRYYDPSTGQFLSVDPDVSQTLQPYVYAAGNPVTEADPAGLSAVNLRAVSTYAFYNVFTAWEWFDDDCADFTSQALQAGGMMFYSGASKGSTTDDRNWFFYPPVPRVRAMHWTHSWSVAHDLAVHLLDWHGKDLPYYNAGLQDGDIIFANWNGNNFSGISHVGAVAVKLSGTSGCLRGLW